MNDQDIKSILTKQAIENAKNESTFQTMECIDGRVYGWFVKFIEDQWFVELLKDAGFRVIWGNTEFTTNTLKAAIEKIWDDYLEEEEKVDYLKHVICKRIVEELE